MSKTISSAVRIVWSKHNKSSIGESPGKSLIVPKCPRVGVGRDYIRWHTFQAMLADHDRSAFAGLDVIWQQQNAPGKDLGTNIKHELVGAPFCLCFIARCR